MKIFNKDEAPAIWAAAAIATIGLAFLFSDELTPKAEGQAAPVQTRIFVSEEDGSPRARVREFKFANGSLTINPNGTASIAGTGGGGGGTNSYTAGTGLALSGANVFSFDAASSPSLTALTLSGLTNNRVLFGGTGGLIRTGAATEAELGWLVGTTNSIQTQLNGMMLRVGSTMTGQLLLYADPTNALAAATKQYVDAGIAGATGTVYTAGAGITKTGNAFSVSTTAITSGTVTATTGVTSPQATLSTANRGRVWVPSWAMIPTSTAGSVPSTVTPSNGATRSVQRFSGTVNNACTFEWLLPQDFLSDLQVRFYVIGVTGSGGVVRMGASAQGQGQTADLNTAFTGQQIADCGTGTTGGFMNYGNLSATLVIDPIGTGGNATAIVMIRLERLATDAADTSSANSDLAGVELFYTKKTTLAN